MDKLTAEEQDFYNSLYSKSQAKFNTYVESGYYSQLLYLLLLLKITLLHITAIFKQVAHLTPIRHAPAQLTL
jgi:hypothetical protein